MYVAKCIYMATPVANYNKDKSFENFISKSVQATLLDKLICDCLSKNPTSSHTN